MSVMVFNAKWEGPPTGWDMVDLGLAAAARWSDDVHERLNEREAAKDDAFWIRHDAHWAAHYANAALDALAGLGMTLAEARRRAAAAGKEIPCTEN